MVTAANDWIIEAAQRAISAFPVIILGSGASIPYGLPSMADLAHGLTSDLQADDLSPKDIEAAEEFKKSLETQDLESALQDVQLSSELTDRIVSYVWQRVVNPDLATYRRVIEDRNHIALTLLFRKLFDSTHNTLTVVTTNYDRIAEYAVDAGGWHHQTGFRHGYLRNREASGRRATISIGGHPARTVQVWKVHGSIDWFQVGGEVTVGLPAIGTNISGLRPEIVTPGIDKYRRTHDEPFRSILAGADAALVSASAYLCIGYGFNDEHIQPKLVEKCQSDNVPLVILAKELTPAAKDFLSSGKSTNFCAFEESGSSTMAYTSNHPSGVEIPDSSLWDLKQFIAVAA